MKRIINRHGALTEVPDDYILQDGESMNVPAWHLVNPMFKDSQTARTAVTINDSEKQMDAEYQKGIDDLNAWRGETPAPEIADAQSMADACEQSTQDLNAWRYK